MEFFIKFLAVWLVLDGILSIIYTTDKRFLSQITRVVRSIFGVVLFFA
jgi:hypothetical protein